MLTPISPSIPYGLLPQGRVGGNDSNPDYNPAGASYSILGYYAKIGGWLPLFDGAMIRPYALSGTSGVSIGTVVPFQMYDVFAFLNTTTGVPNLEKLEWANATVTMAVATPGVVTWTGHPLVTGSSFTPTTTGALLTGLTANTQYYVNVINGNTFNVATTRANLDAATYVNFSGTQSGTHTGHAPTQRQTALSILNGYWCKSTDATRLYLATFLADTTTTFTNSNSRRGLWNLYNQILLPLSSPAETANTWNYTLATIRQSNANTANMVEVINPHPAALTASGAANMIATAQGIAANASAVSIMAGVGVDSTTTNSAPNYGASVLAGTGENPLATYAGSLGLGYHQIVWLEASSAAGTTAWRGDNNVPTLMQAGLSGSIWG